MSLFEIGDIVSTRDRFGSTYHCVIVRNCDRDKYFIDVVYEEVIFVAEDVDDPENENLVRMTCVKCEGDVVAEYKLRKIENPKRIKNIKVRDALLERQKEIIGADMSR